MNLKPNVGCTAFQKPYKYLSCTGVQSSEFLRAYTPHGKNRPRYFTAFYLK